jgi:arylsulfatase
MSIKERERDDVASDVRSAGLTNATPIGGATPINERIAYAYPGATTAPETVATKVLARAHSITAVLEIPPDGAQGVIVSHGNDAGGYTLFVQEQYLHYVHNYCGALELHVVSLDPVPVGRVRVRVEFEPTRKNGIIHGEGMPGRAQLFFGDCMVADKIFPVTVPLAVGSSSGLSIGKNPGTSVSRLYTAPFAFTGKFVSVRYDLSDRMIGETEEPRQALRFSRHTEH